MMKLTIACLCLVGAVAMAAPTQEDSLNRPGCGVPKIKDLRIVGGSEAQKGQYPWIASLQVRRGPFGMSHTCGCSILNEHFILVASHCFGKTPKNPDDFIVRVGTYDQTAGDSEASAVEHKVEKIITHEGFVMFLGIKNDIALLKLKTPIDFSSPYVNSICLPESHVDTDDQIVTVAGWGDTVDGNGNSIPAILKHTDLVAQTDDWCKKRWGATFVTGQMVCAVDDYSSPCVGDSGGPLVLEDAETGVYTQVGVVSYGERSCAGPRPPVFTRVSYFLDWIKKSIAENQ